MTMPQPQTPRRQRRRFGPSQQTSGWSPFLSTSSRGDDVWREREIEQLERALADKGEVSRRELGRLTGCKYWGPGRFGAALREAVDQGRIRKTGRGRYGPAQ
jgi:hypothetical protein